jgi:hypothetical protein
MRAVSVYAEERSALGAYRRLLRRRSARRSALFRGALWLAAGCLELEPALAQPLPQPPGELELRIAYRAPEGCPSGADFMEALRTHLAVGGEGAVDADVLITRVPGAGFELTLALRVAEKETESVVRADSCRALMQLAALNASMARTAARPPGETPAPASALVSPALLPDMRTEADPEGGRLVGFDVSGADQPRAGEAARARAASSVSAFVLAEVRAASGMPPGVSWGRGVAFGVELAPWSLRLAATGWQSSERSFSPGGTSPLPLEFEQRSLELSPCAMYPVSSLLRVEGCATLAAHRIRTSAEAPRWIGAIGAAALGVLSPWRGLRIEAQAGLSVLPVAPAFDVDGWRSVYQAGTFQPTARVAVGWEFGGERTREPAPVGELPLARAASGGHR